MRNQSSFRTLEIVAVTLAVCAMAAGLIYWQMFRVTSPEITSKWLESGGIASVASQLPDKKVAPPEFTSSAEEIAARKTGEEIVSMRTDNTQVFKAKDGQLIAHIYTAPINYLDKTSSTYKPIDTSVHQISDLAKSNPAKQFDEYIDAGVYQATWFADKPWDYKMSVGDSWITYKALFSESTSLSIKIDTLKTGLKETITLKDKTAPTKLQWTVTKSAGKSAIITSPPTAQDANGKDVKIISYQVGDTLTYEVDTTKAVFPVTIDPTSVTATNDGYAYGDSVVSYVTQRDAITGAGKGNTQLSIGQLNIGGEYQTLRSFLSFAIPNTVGNIVSASLLLEGKEDNTTSDFTLVVYASTYSNPLVKEDFDLFTGHQASGTYNGTNLISQWVTSSFSATWNTITFGTSGLTALTAAKNGTFKIALLSSRDVTSTAPTDGVYEFLSFEPTTTAGKEPYISITFAVAPTVTTQSASSVTQTSATFNGNITATGGAGPTVRGFAYGTNSALSGGDTATTTDTTGQPFGTGAFTGTPSSSLICNTTYYSRAYATNSAGTGLGAISASFTTSACSPPTVTTQSASSVAITTATLNGNITNIGSFAPTVRGFAWGTNSALSGGDTATTTDTVGQPFGTGAFSTTTIAFVCNTTYYSRAYATNSAGTGLGAISALFTTSPCLAPTVTTQAVSAVSVTTATGNGNVTSDGGATITERGVVVSTSPNPTVADDKFTAAGTTGAFTASITGRSAGKLYYVRAYATNSIGTSYGSEVTFVTHVSVGSVTITATNDGVLLNYINNDYLGTRNAATAPSKGLSTIGIGQYYQVPEYAVYRGFLSFVLPDMVALSTASLFLDGFADYSTTDFGVYVLTSTYSNPLANEDFDLFDGHQASGAYTGTVLNNTWNSSSYSANWNEFVFNATGTTTIFAARNTTLKLAMISKEDYDGSVPGNDEYLHFSASSLGAGVAPYLSITYEAVAAAPTVTTQDPTDKLATSLTANGNIISIGSAAVTTRGFKYGLTQTDTWDVNESGSFSTGAFSLPITGLTKGTNYYMRSYATNSVGTVYGSYVALTTGLQSDETIFRNNVILNNNVILQ
ncbi:MAG: hypothetical protein NTY93_00885 [Candidatus Kaiserbacteria bacterium]|nr:hypothetical protein [Candidatus Kaiserbacteria bacterium]